MAEDKPSINDNLLDQEIESEMIPGEDDMDIDLAIESALDDLGDDLSLDSGAPTSTFDMLSNDELGSLENLLDGDTASVADLEFEGEAASLSLDDGNIPVINDVFDPSRRKSAPAAPAAMAAAAPVGKDLVKQILAMIEEVVDEAVKNEMGKVATSLKHEVGKQLKSRLPGLLKGK